MTINDPATSGRYLTGTQQVVVEARLAMGYTIERILWNGDIKMYKDSHTMIINCLGYDVYTGNIFYSRRRGYIDM